MINLDYTTYYRRIQRISKKWSYS